MSDMLKNLRERSQKRKRLLAQTVGIHIVTKHKILTFKLQLKND